MSLVLSREEARRELGVSLPTLDKEIAGGRLEVVRLGRRLFVTRASIEKWVTERTSLKNRLASNDEPAAT